jgi:glutamate-1-semialdehyde 2,1-aminomutase
MSRKYAKSEEMLERALKSIPLGSQTFSKSHTQYPRGAAPFFIQRARGARAWDVDGNEYIDFVNALAAVTLGHGDPDVTAAVRAQLEDGVLFTLPHPLEIEVAELLIEMVPSAERVRFGKNGSDATAGAVRAARAFTGRDRVAVCGYHGWQDWYIGTTSRNKGVPADTRALSHPFAYNDLDALHALLKRYPDDIAAVIMEPMSIQAPREGFLEGVRDLTRAHGVVLIFDEMITGFRLSNGGAQALFGVTPDLTTLGKGMANGYPLSAVVGRADIMREFEDVFFSFTMGGECLSLAAAKATLEKVRREPVTETLRHRGERLQSGVRTRIDAHGLTETLAIMGHPTWPVLTIQDHPTADMWAIKTLILQEVLRRGILSIGTHTLSYAHSDEDVDAFLAVYDKVLPMVRDALTMPDGVRARLECEPLKPLFRVR